MSADKGTVLPDDEHNRRLAGHVRPANWVNPEPVARYNLVVIGAGPAGLVVAAAAAGLGAKVALIEKHLLGGDCLNVGCVPSKALIRAARAASDVRDAGPFGVRVPEGVRVDFAAVMERMRRLRADIGANDSADRFKQLGVDVFIGEGRFGGPDSIDVADKTLRFKHAVICTGARASVPPIPGLAQVEPLTNETVFSLTDLPRRLGVIGAGPIGCELAQAFRRFGSEVHLFEVAPQVLIREDADAAAIVQAALARDGVHLHLGVALTGFRREGGDIAVTMEKGRSGEVRLDRVLIGAGRAPNVEALNLEQAGVEFDRNGVKVDDTLKTSNPRIYAAGDVCSPFKFTHAADFMARIVIRNTLFGLLPGKARVSSLLIPWCTFTDPEIAHVGMYERDTAAKGIAARTLVHKLADVDRAILDGETDGFVKVLTRAGSDKILGATIVGRHAGEMINELTLAIQRGVGLGAIASVIHPYPTQAEAIRRLGDAHNRGRLTPISKKLLSMLMAWGR